MRTHKIIGAYIERSIVSRLHSCDHSAARTVHLYSRTRVQSNTQERRKDKKEKPQSSRRFFNPCGTGVGQRERHRSWMRRISLLTGMLFVCLQFIIIFVAILPHEMCALARTSSCRAPFSTNSSWRNMMLSFQYTSRFDIIVAAQTQQTQLRNSMSLPASSYLYTFFSLSFSVFFFIVFPIFIRYP